MVTSCRVVVSWNYHIYSFCVSIMNTNIEMKISVIHKLLTRWERSPNAFEWLKCMWTLKCPQYDHTFLTLIAQLKWLYTEKVIQGMHVLFAYFSSSHTHVFYWCMVRWGPKNKYVSKTLVYVFDFMNCSTPNNEHNWQDLSIQLSKQQTRNPNNHN